MKSLGNETKFQFTGVIVKYFYSRNNHINTFKTEFLYKQVIYSLHLFISFRTSVSRSSVTKREMGKKKAEYKNIVKPNKMESAITESCFKT